MERTHGGGRDPPTAHLWLVLERDLEGPAAPSFRVTCEALQTTVKIKNSVLSLCTHKNFYLLFCYLLGFLRAYILNFKVVVQDQEAKAFSL